MLGKTALVSPSMKRMSSYTTAGFSIAVLTRVYAVSLDDLYAFHYTAVDISQRHVGWNFFDLQSEYLRMGVPNDNWVVSHINKDYEVSWRSHDQAIYLRCCPWDDQLTITWSGYLSKVLSLRCCRLWCYVIIICCSASCPVISCPVICS